MIENILAGKKFVGSIEIHVCKRDENSNYHKISQITACQ